jgi:cobalt-zinc-cadmium efflux system outer membrane protein
VKTFYWLLAILALMPDCVLAQSPTGETQHATTAGLRMLPPVQSDQATPSPLPEPIQPRSLESSVQPGLAMADLESMALAKNPALARAAARVAAARGEWVQVGLPPNPTIGYSGNEIGNSDRAGQQGGFVGQQVITGGKLRLSRAVAEQGLRVAQQQLEAQRYRVVNDVRIDFYEVLAAQRRAEIAEELLATGQRTMNVIEQFLQAKEVSQVDLLQARVETNAARILLENARNDQAAAWRKLAAVVGTPDMQPKPLAGDLQADLGDIVFDDALRTLLNGSPELAAARANADRARQAVTRARVEPVPNLDLAAGVQFDNSTRDTIANVQIGMPIPILNRNQGGIRRAEGEFAAARNDVQRTELDLQQRLATAYQRYANARQQVKTYTDAILPDAQKSIDLVTTGYRQGQFGYLILLTSQRTYFQTKLAYLESLRQLRISAVEIDGLLLTDSLRPDESAR